MKVQPFRTKLSGGSNVYHNNNKCTVGNNIEVHNRISGKGKGRRLCKQCKRLSERKRK